VRARAAVDDREFDLDHQRYAAGKRLRPALADLSGRTRRPLMGKVDGEVARSEPGTGLSLPLLVTPGRADQIDLKAPLGVDQ